MGVLQQEALQRLDTTYHGSCPGAPRDPALLLEVIRVRLEGGEDRRKECLLERLDVGSLPRAGRGHMAAMVGALEERRGPVAGGTDPDTDGWAEGGSELEWGAGPPESAVAPRAQRVAAQWKGTQSRSARQTCALRGGRGAANSRETRIEWACKSPDRGALSRTLQLVTHDPN